ncbi:hypothetical protein F4779DRAFT_616966 [Xylariaceae sp. FL0662B]|nr:hypothetical protein F4779DRAFT_616966 [Xylariaceae sp. FL0662B]
MRQQPDILTPWLQATLETRRRSRPRYDNLGQCVAQQRQITGRHTLELWRAQLLRDGPLRLVPEAANPEDWTRDTGEDVPRRGEGNDIGATELPGPERRAGTNYD